MSEVDDYVANVIGKGDEGSDLLKKLTAPTLTNNEGIEIVGGKPVIRIPKGYLAVSCSAVGDKADGSLESYGASLVSNMAVALMSVGATPIGFTNIIDVQEVHKQNLEDVMFGMVNEAAKENMAAMNGELAVLGDRVDSQANISGTVVGLVKKTTHLFEGMAVAGKFFHEGIRYAFFDPKGEAIFMNCDGTGTKPEFAERTGDHLRPADDLLAMGLDDTVKMAAVARVFSGTIETKGNVNWHEIQRYIEKRADSMGIIGIMEHEVADINGYVGSDVALNFNGTVVSTIDEERLRNPLRSMPGEYMIAIRGKPNPRSNGISDLRKIMVNEYGNDWHKREDCAALLEYLSTPSTVLYPVFKELIGEGLASNVYHMSGGAYKGKLAKPLADQGVYLKMTDMFPISDERRKLFDLSGGNLEAAYEKWPMDTDGFISTDDPKRGMEVIRAHDLECLYVGKLEVAASLRIPTLNGKELSF